MSVVLAWKHERFALWLRKTVGKANGAWRKGAGGAMGAKKSRALRDNPLPLGEHRRISGVDRGAAQQLQARRRGLRDGRRRLFLRGACTRAPRARGDATANAAARGVDQVRRHVLW